MAFVLPVFAAIASAASATAATVGTTAAAASTAAFGTSAAVAGTATTTAGLAGLETASIAAASSVPAWLATAGTASSVLGGAVGAYGAIKSGEAGAASARYNATVEARNADMARRNAAIVGEAGAQQAGNESLKTRAELGAIKTNQAAAGIDINSGSAVDVRQSASDLGELDALTLRSNAVKEAYGYVTQATNYTAQSNLDRFEANQDETTGYINAGSTLLGAAGDTVSNYHKYRMAGGLNF